MAEVDREELAALVRGWSAYFEWARETGAAAVPRVGGRSLAAVSGAATVAVEATDGQREPARAGNDDPPARAARPAVIEPARAPTNASVAAPTSARASVAAPERQAARSPAAVIESAAPAPTSALSRDERVRALSVIADEARACTRCKLCSAGRTQTVFARGDVEATVLFAGEAPGADEDRLGRPFVGKSGELLDKITVAMGLSESEVYIANVAKCRPPNNRPPEPDEAAACGPYLDRQIAIVRPKVIVSWGRTPTAYLLGTTESMTKLRGRWHDYRGIPLLATWHPAYLLRNPDAKKDTWADMKRVLDRLGRTPPAR